MDHVDQGLSFLHCCSSRLPTPLHAENLFAKKTTHRPGWLSDACAPGRRLDGVGKRRLEVHLVKVEPPFFSFALCSTITSQTGVSLPSTPWLCQGVFAYCEEHLMPECIAGL